MTSPAPEALLAALRRFHAAVRDGRVEEAHALMTPAAREELLRALRGADELGIADDATWEDAIRAYGRYLARVEFEARLVDVAVAGERASATLVLEVRDELQPQGSTEREPVAFVHTSAGWLLDVPLDA